METLAAAAASMIAPYMAKGADAFVSEVGKAGADAVSRLVGFVRDRFRHGDERHAEQVLARAAERPEDERRLRPLADLLGEEAEQDGDFAAELKRLVDAAAQTSPSLAGQINRWSTQIAGANYGDIINAGSIDTLTTGARHLASPSTADPPQDG